MVNVIGKIREYGSVPFISAEIVRKSCSEEMVLRKKELQLVKRFYKKEEASAPVAEESIVGPAGEAVLSLLKELDGGEGVDAELLIEKSGIKNANEIIRELIHNGDVFEIMPGRLKILE